MNRVPFQTILLFVVVMSLSGCKQEKPTEPQELSSQFIPLAIGNHWTYVDSALSVIGITVNSYTVSIESVRTQESIKWWKFRNAFNPSIASSELSIRNDSLFSRQRTRSPNGIVPIVSLEYIPPPTVDTTFFNSLFDGDVLVWKSVTRLARAYPVPAGIFNGCALYEYDIYPEHYREVLMPGLGVLSCEIWADSTLFGPAWHRKIQLVSYGLLN